MREDPKTSRDFRRPPSKRSEIAKDAQAAQEQPLRGNLKKNGKKSANDGKEKRVDFSSLEILEFLIQIGDNPSCEGAPLCISDECQKQRKLDVDEFEATRKGRRQRKQLVLSATKRSKL